MNRGRVLGLDPSKTRTGWAVVEGASLGRGELIAAGSFASSAVSEFAEWIKLLIGSHRADMVVAEMARQDIALYQKKGLVAGRAGFATVNADQTVLWKLEGATIAVAQVLEKPFVLVAAPTWRKAMLGNGKLPRAAAKLAAMNWCELQRIDVANHDCAEAVCIAHYGIATIDFRYAMQRVDRSVSPT